MSLTPTKETLRSKSSPSLDQNQRSGRSPFLLVFNTQEVQHAHEVQEVQGK